MRVSFSFRGHDTDTYRVVAAGHGAFELCLPSLGILYQIYFLRYAILGRTPRLARLGVVLGSGGHRVYGSEDYAMSVGVMYCGLAVSPRVRVGDVQTTMQACSPHPVRQPPVPGLIRLCVLARSLNLCVIYTGPLSRSRRRPSNGLHPLAIPRWPSI